jgi:DNA-binding FadR family transcriptional regulator
MDRKALMHRTELKRPKLYEEVSRCLEERIVGGHYAAGDLLPSERELMERFHVSRSAVREALFHLRMMGLVEIRSGTPARVVRPSSRTVLDTVSGAARQLLAAPGGMQDFQNARQFFETGLARYAAEHATPADLAALDAALQENGAAIGDLARFRETDVSFHRVLALIPQNPIFTAIADALHDWLLEQRRICLEPGGEGEIYRAHAAIFAGIAARDSDRAEAAMREHLQDIARRAARAQGVPDKTTNDRQQGGAGRRRSA